MNMPSSACIGEVLLTLPKNNGGFYYSLVKHREGITPRDLNSLENKIININ